MSDIFKCPSRDSEYRAFLVPHLELYREVLAGSEQVVGRRVEVSGVSAPLTSLSSVKLWIV